MPDYYSSIILIVLLSLVVLCILVKENDRIRKEDKWRFYLTYIVIGLAALAEWTGVCISGNAAVPRWVLQAVKTVDYILTPLAGGAIVLQMNLRNTWQKALLCTLAVNCVFQLVSAFTGWMLVIDESNHYFHGTLYPVYIALYAVIFLIVGVEFILYGQRFRKHNRLSLYTILAVITSGIAIQELFGSEFRTAYMAMAVGAAMLFIHLVEFSQIRSDEIIEEQKVLITRDALTGLQSRFAYSAALDEYSASGLPQDMVVFMIDINGLKRVNDTLGHEAGDELICGAAECITRAFGDDFRAFRVGGDEFVVLGQMPQEAVAPAVAALKKQTTLWSGKKVKSVTLSVGTAAAAENPGLSLEQLINQADLSMYIEKAQYYKETGIERRRI